MINKEFDSSILRFVNRRLYCNLVAASERASVRTVELRTRGEVSTTWCLGAAVMALVCMTTVTGNLAVVAALRRARRIPTHYPLGSLALADLLVGTCVVPLAAARELFVFQLNWVICAWWSTLDVLCCTASILSLCALGWERWNGIANPLASAKRFRRARLLAVLIWPVSIAVAMPTAFIPSSVHYQQGEEAKACTVNTNTWYVFFSVTFSFYLPASVMVVMYARIIRSLSAPPPIRAHRGRTAAGDQAQTNNPTSPRNQAPENSNQDGGRNQSNNILSTIANRLNLPQMMAAVRAPSPIKSPINSPAGMMTRQRRATRTIVRLMSLFLVCWTPFFIMLPVDSLCECVWDATWQWCTWLGYANSALDPLVYAAASPSVRRALRASVSWSSGTRSTDTPSSPAPRRN